MSRYIDADDFDKELLSGWVSQALGVSHRRKYTIGEIREMIQKRPTADVVEVVRCKDCKWGRETCGNIECFVDLNAPPDYHGYDWYCPNGEKVSE